MLRREAAVRHQGVVGIVAKWKVGPSIGHSSDSAPAACSLGELGPGVPDFQVLYIRSHPCSHYWLPLHIT